MRHLPLLILLLVSAPALADSEVYKWVDKDGVVHYADKPPAPGARPHALPHLQTFGEVQKEEAPSAAPATSPRPKSPTGGPPVRILKPTAGATLTSEDGKFTMVVEVALEDGQLLNYSLDGAAHNPVPTPSTAYLFEGVAQGPHKLHASVVSEDGRELSRSETVSVTLKPLSTSP